MGLGESRLRSKANCLDIPMFCPYPKQLNVLCISYMNFNFRLSCRNDTKEDVFVHQVRLPWNRKVLPLDNLLCVTRVSRLEVVKEPYVFQELLLEHNQLFLTIGLQVEPAGSGGFAYPRTSIVRTWDMWGWVGWYCIVMKIALSAGMLCWLGNNCLKSS